MIRRGAEPETSSIATAGRDLRLDLFRGLALWLIFLDHIPSNIVNWLTIRNYGFSDAAEIFVFISGYTAAFVYGRDDAAARRRRGERAHPQARLAGLRGARLHLRDLHGGDRLPDAAASTTRSTTRRWARSISCKQPGDTLIEALLLKFKPVFMDVLPLYIVLLLAFPPVLWLLLRAPDARACRLGRALCAELEF